MNRKVRFGVVVACCSGIVVILVLLYQAALNRRIQQALEGLRSNDLTIAMNAVHRVSASNHPGRISALTEALDHPHQFVRIDAAKALWQLGEEGQIVVMAVCLRRIDTPGCDFDKGNAINILGELAVETVIPKLIAILGVRDKAGPDGVIQFSCQHAAATALSKMGPAALPALKQALRNNNSEIRLFAILAVSWMGTVGIAARDELWSLLTDPDPRVQERASATLQKLEAGK